MVAAALLFDLDGTLWNSYPWFAKRLAAAAAVSEETILASLKSGSSIVSLQKSLHVTDSRFIKDCHELELFSGVHAGLLQLHNKGIPLGVVTSLPGRFVEPMLDGSGIRGFFATVIHAGTRPLKPNPTPLLAAMQHLSVGKENVFYVGDMPTDAEAASRAGISFVWAAYGYGKARPLQTKAVIQSFSDVLQI